MEKKSIEEVVAELKTKFQNSILSIEQQYDFNVITIEKNQLIPVITFLYNHPLFQFRYLTTLCGLHFPDQEKPFGMMYQLHSLQHNLRIRLKSFTSASDLTFDTLTSLFSAANWMEREAFDFYGIQFKGHPNLKRILNVDNMDYHPMRKEYKLEDATRTDKNDTMFGRDGNSKIIV